MSHFRLLAIIAFAVAALTSAAPAAASGPAAPGKSLIQVNCGSAGTFSPAPVPDLEIPKNV